MYIDFLRAKLNYHRTHPAFSGTFDYEEYVTLMGVEDPNEGYETIFELMGLLDRIDTFVKAIFSNLKSYGSNELRTSVLVPLVEESYGIYQFIVPMMAAMHTSIDN
jgi:huntingtin-interacting protein 1-related protein